MLHFSVVYGDVMMDYIKISSLFQTASWSDYSEIREQDYHWVWTKLLLQVRWSHYRVETESNTSLENQLEICGLNNEEAFQWRFAVSKLAVSKSWTYSSGQRDVEPCLGLNWDNVSKVMSHIPIRFHLISGISGTVVKN